MTIDFLLYDKPQNKVRIESEFPDGACSGLLLNEANNLVRQYEIVRSANPSYKDNEVLLSMAQKLLELAWHSCRVYSLGNVPEEMLDLDDKLTELTEKPFTYIEDKTQRLHAIEEFLTGSIN